MMAPYIFCYGVICRPLEITNMAEKRTLMDEHIKKSIISGASLVGNELHKWLPLPTVTNILSLLMDQGIERMSLFMTLSANDFERLGITKAGHLIALAKVQESMVEVRKKMLLNPPVPPKTTSTALVVAPTTNLAQIQKSLQILPHPADATKLFPTGKDMTITKSQLKTAVAPKTTPEPKQHPPFARGAALVSQFISTAPMCNIVQKGVITLLAEKWAAKEIPPEKFWENVKAVLGSQYDRFVLAFDGEYKKQTK